MFTYSRLSHFTELRLCTLLEFASKSIMTVPQTSSETVESLIKIPSQVRGMKQLDKNKFQATFTFPVLPIDARSISRIRGCLLKFTIKPFGKSLKPIMDGSSKEDKIIVLNPDIVNTNEIRQKVRDRVSAAAGTSSGEITERDFTIGFNEWDQRAIFRAVLPDGVEFSSFTQTGHLIHCNLTDDLLSYGKVIGEILLEKNATCKTVVNKPDKISNTFRTFDVDLLAGEPNYVVETIEDGIRYRMDFTKVFWNSRLSHEHARVIKHLQPSSLVFDACAGIGPFVIPSARKHNSPQVIYANDLNPESVRWMKENAKINHLREGSVEFFNQDAAAFLRGAVRECILEHAALPSSSRPECAHVIINLPALAVTFLPAFRGMLHEKKESIKAEDEPFPVITYCYLFAKAHEDVPADWYAQRARQMVEEQLNFEGVSIRKTHRVRTVSNRKEMFCVEIEMPWKLMRAAAEEEEKDASTEEPDAKRLKVV